MNASDKIGFRFGIIAFIATVAYVIVQLLQILEILKFPIDEILIYSSSLCISIPFLLSMLALHYRTTVSRKIWSHAAVLFSTIYVVFVAANYIVQLATVIPAKLNGRIKEVAILEQTPHSMFWNFDALGYIFMGLATLIAIPALEKKGIQKWVRISFAANAAAIPLISIVYFYPDYSHRLLLLGFVWAITAPVAMLMLALSFRPAEKNRWPLQQKGKFTST